MSRSPLTSCCIMGNVSVPHDPGAGFLAATPNPQQKSSASFPPRHSISSFIWRQTLFSRSLPVSHLLCLNTCFVASPLFTAATLFSLASSCVRTQTRAHQSDAEPSKALRCRWIRLRMLRFCRLCLFLLLRSSEVCGCLPSVYTHDAAEHGFSHEGRVERR